MKQITTVMSIVLAFSLAAASQGRGSKGPAPESIQYPPLAKTEAEKRILATMSEVVKAGELYANVPAVGPKSCSRAGFGRDPLRSRLRPSRRQGMGG